MVAFDVAISDLRLGNVKIIQKKIASKKTWDNFVFLYIENIVK
jgi:hypothetical protein